MSAPHPAAPAAPAAGPTATDATWLARAVALAVENVADGGGPFGAVVVRDGEVVATGQNRVTPTLDPTAHAEVQAIRAACRALGDFSLAGCELFSSCEPCPMCVAASLWARVDRVVYAADRDDAAHGGFDDRAFYDLLAAPREQWAMPVVQVRPDDAAAPFDAWLAKVDRTRY
ncbi:nucleoside deaminase [Nocardioides sp. ChNu-153]|uniref:nucleoside deaminase n=1 Tax=unclassified Nocardioides TaxID=2615069 RepID=UPI00240660AC|nr:MULTISPECIES: nucleoside deaminase [unclassified Nocardioides]MDF9717743.1 nucleoside deaminase [Nocardioides sp. ChNu-99]MDN7120189.1 nucleoside deaminase [Nocardioides sp. ChNu-153]